MVKTDELIDKVKTDGMAALDDELRKLGVKKPREHHIWSLVQYISIAESIGIAMQIESFADAYITEMRRSLAQKVEQTQTRRKHVESKRTR